MRIGKTKEGLVEIIRKRGGSILVRPLNRIKAVWLKGKAANEIKQSEKGISLRMAKEVSFDQDCGCTAVVEFLDGGKIETFNVYGDIKKYIRSKLRKGLDLSEHHRRKHLKENGFVRGKGLRRKMKKGDQGRKIRQFERNGYQVVV